MAPDEYSFNYRDGNPIEMSKEPALLQYKYKTKHIPDFVSGIHSFPVVSERFKKVIENAETDWVEFHPIEIVCAKTNEKDSSYYFMNVLSNIRCIDRQRSIYENYPGVEIIYSIERLVIANIPVGDRNIFRVAEIPTILLVSEKLCGMLGKEGISGIDLVPVENYKLS